MRKEKTTTSKKRLASRPGRRKVGKGFFVITYGTAAEGGYTVNVMPSSRNHEILLIYVLQGNFGVIYKTNLGGLLYPELIRDVNEETFIALLKKIWH